MRAEKKKDFLLSIPSKYFFYEINENKNWNQGGKIRENLKQREIEIFADS